MVRERFLKVALSTVQQLSSHFHRVPQTHFEFDRQKACIQKHLPLLFCTPSRYNVKTVCNQSCKLVIFNLILTRHQNWVKGKFADCVDVSTCLIFFKQEYNHERFLKVPLSTVQQSLSYFHWVPTWYSLIHINKTTTLKGFLLFLYQKFNKSPSDSHWIS